MAKGFRAEEVEATGARQVLDLSVGPKRLALFLGFRGCGSNSSLPLANVQPLMWLPSDTTLRPWPPRFVGERATSELCDRRPGVAKATTIS